MRSEQEIFDELAALSVSPDTATQLPISATAIISLDWAMS
jgi:hypothetical protein